MNWMNWSDLICALLLGLMVAISVSWSARTDARRARDQVESRLAECRRLNLEPVIEFWADGPRVSHCVPKGSAVRLE